MANWKGCHCDYSCFHLTIRHINQAFSMTVFFQHLPLNTLSLERIFGLYRYFKNNTSSPITYPFCIDVGLLSLPLPIMLAIILPLLPSYISEPI